jgi:hypothetical protein
MSDDVRNGAARSLVLEFALLYLEEWAAEASFEADAAERVVFAVQRLAEAYEAVAARAARRTASLLPVERGDGESLAELPAAWEAATERAARRSRANAERAQRLASRARRLRAEAAHRAELSEAVSVAATAVDTRALDQQFVPKLIELVGQLSAERPAPSSRRERWALVGQLRALGEGRG